MRPVVPFAVILCLALCPGLVFAAGAETQKWSVGFNESALTFTGTQMGTPFKGTVQKYRPDIHFDLDHPEKCAIAVAVDMNSIATGDKDRDRTAAAPEWFDLSRFPGAQFKADSCRKTGDKAYEANGTLTIKGVPVPLVLAFTVEVASKSDPLRARVKGTAALDRSKFGLGTGEWADASVVANEVTVEFDLVAYQVK